MESGMAEAFVTLGCANCGAKLEVYDDMNRFACRYCGTEMMVHRRGDTVALKTVAEAIQRVQAGTEKTAAELAIVRIEKELEAAKGREHDLLSAHDQTVGRSICVGVAAFVAAIIAIASGALTTSLILLLTAFCGIVYGLQRKPPEEIAELREKIRSAEHHLAEAKAVVER